MTTEEKGQRAEETQRAGCIAVCVCCRAVYQPINTVLMSSSAHEIYTHPQLKLHVCVFGSAPLPCLSLFHAVMIHDTLNYTLYYCPAGCQDSKGIKMRAVRKQPLFEAVSATLDEKHARLFIAL